MNLQSPSRHSRRRPALPSSTPLTLPAVHGSRATGHEPQHPDPPSLITHHHPPITAFLIATQLLEIHLTYSQQTRKRFLIATFSSCLAQAPRLAAHQSLITVHKSRVTNHDSRYNLAFLRAAGQSNNQPARAAGRRRPARHEIGFGLRSSNVAARILPH
jgi:hypothetical protein